MRSPSTWLAHRIPFFYGWVVIGVAFVTMAIGVNCRTAFSLLYPPILDEFGWERGVTAAAFSLGFAASVAVAPFTGMLMDRVGPAVVISTGALLVSLGLVLSTYISTPLELYLSLGVLVVGASVFMSYIGHSAFLPRWFDRKRGLAVGIAFAGVGVGSIVLFPWVQAVIDTNGWREACIAMAIVIVVTIIPLNLLLQRRQPQDLGLAPDGLRARADATDPAPPDNVVDHDWVSVEWTIASALRTRRYWWMFLGLITGLYTWYAVQVHQTRYIIETGFSEAQAAFALGLVGLTGIVGQIGLGHLSDRVGREVGWTLACAGFGLCYGLLILLQDYPSIYLVYAIACAQGILGYGIAPIYSAIVAEIFQGRNFGSIFGTVSVATTLGAASGPWVTGVLYDRTGSYDLGFAVGLVLAAISCAAIWLAGPRQIRLVAGRADARARRAREANPNVLSAAVGVAAAASALAASARTPAPEEQTAPGLVASLTPAPALTSGHPNDRADPSDAPDALRASTQVHTIAVRSTPIVLAAGTTASLRAFALDRRGNSVLTELTYAWSLDGPLLSRGVRLIPSRNAIPSSESEAKITAGDQAAQGWLTITGTDPDGGLVRVRREVTIT